MIFTKQWEFTEIRKMGQQMVRWKSNRDARTLKLLWRKFRSPDGADGKSGQLRTGKAALPYRLQPEGHAQAVRHDGWYGSAQSKEVMADFLIHNSRSPCLFPGKMEEG